MPSQFLELNIYFSLLRQGLDCKLKHWKLKWKQECGGKLEIWIEGEGCVFLGPHLPVAGVTHS